MRSTLLATMVLATLPAVLPAQGGGIRVMIDSGQRRILARPADSVGIVYSSVPRSRARIGITVSLAPNETDRYGALIEAVVPRGPADLAGVRAGDIIVRVNDIAVSNSGIVGGAGGLSIVGEKLITTLANLQPGKPATLVVRRGGSNLSLKVTPDRDESVVTSTIASSRFLEEAMANGARNFSFTTVDSLRTPVVREMFTFFDSTGRMGGATLRLRGGGDGDSTSTVFAGRSLLLSLPAEMLRAELRATNDSTRTVAGEAMGRAMALERQAMTGRVQEGLREIEMPTRTFVRSSFDALSRLELAPLNKELGNYFGTSEGVLVLSISPPGVVVVNGVAVTTEQRLALSAPSRATNLPKETAKHDAADTEILNLKPGDVITAVDGRPVSTPEQLIRVLRSYQRDDDVKLTVHRQKKSLNINTRMPL